jgi:hypothetical protein
MALNERVVLNDDVLIRRLFNDAVPIEGVIKSLNFVT